MSIKDWITEWCQRIRFFLIDLLAGNDLQVMINTTVEDGTVIIDKPSIVYRCKFDGSAMTDEFTLGQIKAAFFAEFTGTGELWFPYQCSKREQAEAVVTLWQSFVEGLTGTWGEDETIPEAYTE